MMKVPTPPDLAHCVWDLTTHRVDLRLCRLENPRKAPFGGTGMPEELISAHRRARRSGFPGAGSAATARTQVAIAGDDFRGRHRHDAPGNSARAVAPKEVRLGPDARASR